MNDARTSGRCAALGAALALAGCGDPAPAPRVRVLEALHDFGSVLEGEVASCTFLLENAGDAPLHVLDVRYTCGCLEAAAEPTDVAPGARCRVQVKFLSQDHPGRNDRFVTVRTDDPETPQVRLRVLAEVGRAVAVEPELFDFGRVLQGDAATAAVTLRSLDGVPFEVLGVACSDPSLAFAFEPAGDVPPAWRVVATLSSGAPVGWRGLNGVVVRLRHPVHGAFTLRTSGEVVDPVAVEPGSLVLPDLLPGRGAEGTIRLTNLRPDRPLAAPAVSVIAPEGPSGRPWVHAEVRTVEEGQRFEVVVRADPDPPLPEFLALVQIRLRPSDPRLHTVAVHGRRRESERP